MKTIIIFLSCMILLNNSGCTQTQNNISDKQEVQMLKDFYTAYSSVMFTVKDIHKIESLQKKYCTIRLRRELRKEIEVAGLDHDLLTNDYGINVKALNTMSVTKDSVKINSFIVSYVLPTLSASYKLIEAKVVIHVIVVKEEGSFKIDSVW